MATGCRSLVRWPQLRAGNSPDGVRKYSSRARRTPLSHLPAAALRPHRLCLQKMKNPESCARWLMACAPSTYCVLKFAYSAPTRTEGVGSTKRFTSNDLRPPGEVVEAPSGVVDVVRLGEAVERRRPLAHDDRPSVGRTCAGGLGEVPNGAVVFRLADDPLLSHEPERRQLDEDRRGSRTC
jgi:hypothetical protein